MLWEEHGFRVLACGNVWLDQPVANTCGNLAESGFVEPDSHLRRGGCTRLPGRAGLLQRA